MTSIKARGPTDPPIETEVEGEIREFVQRDVETLRRGPENESERVANNIGTLLQRVRGTSAQEIDRLIAELQTLRDMLQDEGVRIQREITQYAHLSQSAMQTTRIIAESLAKWKSEANSSAASPSDTAPQSPSP